MPIKTFSIRIRWNRKCRGKRANTSQTHTYCLPNYPIICAYMKICHPFILICLAPFSNIAGQIECVCVVRVVRYHHLLSPPHSIHKCRQIFTQVVLVRTTDRDSYTLLGGVAGQFHQFVTMCFLLSRYIPCSYTGGVVLNSHSEVTYLVLWPIFIVSSC